MSLSLPVPQEAQECQHMEFQSVSGLTQVGQYGSMEPSCQYKLLPCKAQPRCWGTASCSCTTYKHKETYFSYIRFCTLQTAPISRMNICFQFWARDPLTKGKRNSEHKPRHVYSEMGQSGWIGPGGGRIGNVGACCFLSPFPGTIKQHRSMQTCTHNFEVEVDP